jgi:3-hydroxyacyl-[acyl-carrier-protein] dehydratase
MAQTGGVLCVLASPNKQARPYVYFMTIDDAKFRKPVLPGDVLEYHVTLVKKRSTMWWYQGEAKVGGELVAEAKLGAMMRDA